MNESVKKKLKANTINS